MRNLLRVNLIRSAIILTLTLAIIFGLTTTLAAAVTTEGCYFVSSIAYQIAKARDFGVTPEVVFNALISDGMEPKSAAELLELVYIAGLEFTPTEIRGGVFSTCIAGSE